MRILWMTWRDRRHPLAGGAEVINEELAKRLAADGHEVVFIVSVFRGGKSVERHPDGYTIYRTGSRYTVYWQARELYRKRFEDWADIVIDEVNTIPFFAKRYVREPNILFIHQLAREVWFYQMPFPLSLVGYLFEPFYLRSLQDRRVITVSESTKHNLIEHGFEPHKISIITEGIELQPIADLESVEKFERPTILALGALRAMKRTEMTLKAFEIAKEHIPELELIVAGDHKSRYGRKIHHLIARSPYRDSIRVFGKVSQEKKLELMQKSHILSVTSVKEGWGLVVTEANSQGTPSAVFNVDGLRNSVRDAVTGIVCTKNLADDLAAAYVVMLENPKFYETIRRQAWEWSKEINFDRSYADFKEALALSTHPDNQRPGNPASVKSARRGEFSPSPL